LPGNIWGNSGLERFFQDVRSGDLKAVAAALDAGADVNAADIHGNTAIMVAASAGRTSVAQLLLERGARVNARNKQGDTALMIAAARGDVGLQRLIQAYVEKGEAAAALGAAATPAANAPQLKERLFLAVRAGDLTQVKSLLHQGAELEAVEKDFGATPLMWAAMSGQADVAKYLLDSGAKIDAQDKDGRTALMWAASQGQVPVVKLLLSRGANPALADTVGVTALAAASSQGHTEVIQLLRRVLGDRAQQQEPVSTRPRQGRTSEARRPAEATPQQAASEPPAAATAIPSGSDYTPPMGHAGR